MRDANMRYNPELDRWSVSYGDNDYGIHCGELIDLMLNGRAIPCRLEFGKAWYVVVDEVELGLRPSKVYSIRI